MPAVSPANLTLLRETRHATRLYLHVYRPATIWTAQVDGTQSDGDTTITVKTVNQVRAPAKNFQVLFGTVAGGSDLGEARWKSYGAPTLNVGAHNAALPNNAYVTVKEEIKPRAINVYLDASDVVYEDGDIAYTNENTDYMPLARIGCAAVEFRDSTTGIATVNFWSSSVAYGGALASYAWDFKDGNPASSAIAGTALAPIAVDFATAGARYVSFAVTDANGKTHTRYIPVFTPDLYGADAPYSAIEIKSIDGDVGSSGWSASLRVLGDADTTEFPNGALIVLSARDFYGATKQSIGGQWTHRENIVLQGYVVNGTVEKNAQTGAVEFDVEGIGVLAERLPGLAATFNTGAGSAWHNFSGLTYNLAAHHLLTQHCTLSQIADVNLGLLTYADNAIDLNEGSLQSQLNQAIASPTRGIFGSSAQGMLYLQSDPQLIPVADRTNPTILNTQLADFRDRLDLGDENAQKKVSRVELESAQANDDPLFSLAPPDAWDSGNPEKASGIRADDQAESNEIAGCLEGNANNQFNAVVIQWRGNYRVFDPFPCEAVNITIAAIQNLRGLIWTNQRCWTKSVAYEYSPGGILLVASSVTKDSVPSAGITGPVPDTSEPLPDPPNPEPYTPPDPITPPGPAPDSWLLAAYLCTNAGIFFTDDSLAITDPQPVWSQVNVGLPDLNIQILTADPYTPATVQYCLPQSRDLYRRQSGGNWIKILDDATLRALFGFAVPFSDYIETVTTNVDQPGYIAVVWNYTNASTDFYYAYSTDYGTTWQKHNTTPIGNNMNGYDRGFAHGLYKGASIYTAGAVVYFASASGGGGNNLLWVSTDSGATWTNRAGFAAAIGAGGFALQLDDFQDNIYCYCANGILKSIDLGANWTTIADPATYPDIDQTGQQVSGYQLMPLYNPAISPTQTIRAVGVTGKLWKTINAGTLWVDTAEGAGWGAGLNHLEKGILVLGNANGKIYGIALKGTTDGNTHVIQVSGDEGATWTGKAGTNFATPPYINAVPTDALIRGLLPIWVLAP